MKSPDINSPRTWRPYKPEMCDDCRAGCCHMPVEVTVEDLVRLEVLQVDDWENSPTKALKSLKRQGVVTNYREKTGKFTLQQKSDLSCAFLDPNARCTVYDKRPQTCRNFPKISSRPGFCPAERKK